MEEFRTPGQLIKHLLTQRGWTQKVLSVILGMDETSINHLLSGRRSVTAELAIVLGELFDEPAEQFIALQRDYDLARARIEARPDPDRATRAHIFSSLPVLEMIKRGWLAADDIKDMATVEKALTQFFHAESLSQIEILPFAAKKTETFEPASAAQLAWLYRVKELAEDMIVGTFTSDSGRSAVTQLRHLLSAPEEARRAPRVLAECGIRYLVVETLSTAKIDGVCFWLDGRSPVIAMTLRYDRIDNFWFVLRHELEHVLRGHGRSYAMLDAELEGERAGTGAGLAEEERVANEAAADFCVPNAAFRKFVTNKSPFFNERDILGFAKTIHIHPGIVAGRLQHETGRYDRFRQHLAKIRYAVAPGSVVDGWGDIAPLG
jgi:HTH-type transcriptional regulator/antitoxin HigA